MSNIPKISIVTTSLNQGKYLEQTIQSVLGQNYPNLEYIVMDGGSKDNSLKIIKKYSRKLKYWVSKPDKGQYDAINKGFKKATGEIITWINSDDILMPGSLNLVANIFSQLPKVHWISGIPTVINDEGLIVHVGHKRAFIKKFLESGFYHGAGLGFIMQEGTFWRRKLWDKAGGKVKRLNYGFDYELWKKFAQHAELTAVYTSLAAFRLNPERKTKKLTKYYKEIGVPFPNQLKYLMFPARFFVHHLLRLTRASSKISYHSKKYKWYYHSSGFLNWPPFSRKKIFISNQALSVGKKSSKQETVKGNY
jgi:glycosyltransferase involved in cell wall biosynthesis